MTAWHITLSEWPGPHEFVALRANISITSINENVDAVGVIAVILAFSIRKILYFL